MKIRLILWLLVFCCPVCVWANVGHEGGMAERQVKCDASLDSLIFILDLENENGIYIAPQPVVFTIEADVPGDRSILNLTCVVTTDMYVPVDSLTYVVRPDSAGSIRQRISFMPSVAGFYRVLVYAGDGTSKSPAKRFNVGYDPEQIVSSPDAKVDFTDFWKETRDGLDRVKPRYKTTLMKEKCSGIKNMYHVEMYSWGNVKIEGYYTVPKHPGKHPAIIRFMGYAANPRFPDPNVLPDFCEFILSVRGQGIQKAVNPYGDWIIYGLPDKDTYYYRGAYMDLIRGIDFLVSRPEVDAGNIMAEGGSQGGAFTLVACALDKRIKAAAPRIPFLSDFRDYFNICPWPRSVFEGYLKEHPDENWEKIYGVLSYFDIKNLTGQISCPIIMGVGLQDETCPPHTNFAGYNQINAEKKYYVYPNQKHSVDDSWWAVREAFFRENLKTSSRK